VIYLHHDVDTNRIFVSTGGSKDERFRLLPGSRWLPTRKIWSIVGTAGVAQRVVEACGVDRTDPTKSFVRLLNKNSSIEEAEAVRDAKALPQPPIRRLKSWTHQKQAMSSKIAHKSSGSLSPARKPHSKMYGSRSSPNTGRPTTGHLSSSSEMEASLNAQIELMITLLRRTLDEGLSLLTTKFFGSQPLEIWQSRVTGILLSLTSLIGFDQLGAVLLDIYFGSGSGRPRGCAFLALRWLMDLETSMVSTDS
jgi:hypothetical protein